MSIRLSSVDTGLRSVRISVEGDVKKAADIRELRLRADGPGDAPRRYRHRQFRARRSLPAQVPFQRPRQRSGRRRDGQGLQRDRCRQGRGSDLSAFRRGAALRRRRRSDRQPAGRGDRCGQRIHACARRSSHHRARRLVRVDRLAIGPRHRHCHSAGAGRHLCTDVRTRHRPAAHLARRTDHRARPACRRCNDRRRDDGAKAGGGARQDRRGKLRLFLNRLPDADRHADHHG